MICLKNTFSTIIFIWILFQLAQQPVLTEMKATAAHPFTVLVKGLDDSLVQMHE